MSILRKPIEKLARGVKNKLYDTGRALARVAYTIIPSFSYAITESKQDEINNSFFLWRWLAKFPCLYGNDIETLNKINDYSAKGVGIAAALLIGDQINREAEKLMPESPAKREVLQSAGYFTAANLANLAMNLNNLQSNSMLELLLQNAQDTLIKAKETALNLQDMYNGSDANSMAYAGIATLTFLAIAKPALRLVGEMHRTIEKADENYKNRRIANRLIKTAKNLKNKQK